MTKVCSEIPPKMKNFRFEMTKVYFGIPPNEKLQIWDDQNLLRNTSPMKNFRFEMTKVYSGIPPPNEKLQIWDDQSLLWNTPPMKNFRFEMTKVYSGIPPPQNEKLGRSYVETKSVSPVDTISFPLLMVSTDIRIRTFRHRFTTQCFLLSSIHKSRARILLLWFLLRTFLSFFFLLYFFIRKDLDAKINIGMFVFLSIPSFSVSAPCNFFLVYFYFITFQENFNGENKLRLPVGLHDDFSFQIKILFALHLTPYDYGIVLHLFNSTHFKSAKVAKEST